MHSMEHFPRTRPDARRDESRISTQLGVVCQIQVPDAAVHRSIVSEWLASGGGHGGTRGSPARGVPVACGRADWLTVETRLSSIAALLFSIGQTPGPESPLRLELLAGPR